MLPFCSSIPGVRIVTLTDREKHMIVISIGEAMPWRFPGVTGQHWPSSTPSSGCQISKNQLSDSSRNRCTYEMERPPTERLTIFPITARYRRRGLDRGDNGLKPGDVEVCIINASLNVSSSYLLICNKRRLAKKPPAFLWVDCVSKITFRAPDRRSSRFSPGCRMEMA